MIVARGAASGTAAEHPRRPAWIYGRGTDLFIAWCWVPIWLVGHALSAGHGAHDDDLLRRALAATFLLSFLHQPLTLGLVYGDARQFNQRRRLFVWAPVVTIAVVWLAVASHLWVVIPIAAVWNTVHTLQQRYGLSRIYARKSGYGSAFLDRSVLYAWMVCALLVVAANADTTRLVRRIGLDQVNAGGIRLLTDARPVALLLLVPAGLWALAVTVALVRQEAGSAAPNRAKWGYQTSSLLLIASLAVDPAAGFIAYVGAHAIEYFVVVYRTTASRYGARSSPAPAASGPPGSGYRGPLPWVARRAPGRVAALAAVVALALAAHARLHGDAYNAVLYTVGILHFLYDGFIWKLRKPAVASDFAIPAAALP
jgi:hypothetical protein